MLWWMRQLESVAIRRRFGHDRGSLSALAIISEVNLEVDMLERLGVAGGSGYDCWKARVCDDGACTSDFGILVTCNKLA